MKIKTMMVTYGGLTALLLSTTAFAQELPELPPIPDMSGMSAPAPSMAESDSMPTIPDMPDFDAEVPPAMSSAEVPDDFPALEPNAEIPDFAQEDTPDAEIPDFAEMDAPFVLPPQEELSEPEAMEDMETAANPDISLPEINDEQLEFFQPGMQLDDAPQDMGNPFAAPMFDMPEGPAITDLEPIAPPKPRMSRMPTQVPVMKRFNYKRQQLPAAIYKPHYDAANRHLPKAQTVRSYEAATFEAAAKNDLNGVRAMLQSGGSIHMRNASGSSLAQIAAYYGAHDVLRYLAAKGADMSGVQQVSQPHYYAAPQPVAQAAPQAAPPAQYYAQAPHAAPVVPVASSGRYQSRYVNPIGSRY